MILAQLAGYGLIQWIVIAIVLAGVIGIAMIAIKAAGIDIPGWVIQILWIVLVVIVAVVAIKFLAGML